MAGRPAARDRSGVPYRGFALWERHTPHAMVPPVLLRARSFVSASVVYLVCYIALSGVLFYVTLLYQDVNGWSVLRTGLSWLFLNGPFMLMAQLTGPARPPLRARHDRGRWLCRRRDRHFRVEQGKHHESVRSDCPWIRLLRRRFRHVRPRRHARRDARRSPRNLGRSSALVNACRQIGTTVGLAILGSPGVTTAISNWNTAARQFSGPSRTVAAGQAQNVGGARISAVVNALGSSYRQPAADAFVSGYHLAVGVGAACLLVAAAIALLGFRQAPAVAPPSPVSASARTLTKSDSVG